LKKTSNQKLSIIRCVFLIISTLITDISAGNTSKSEAKNSANKNHYNIIVAEKYLGNFNDINESIYDIKGGFSVKHVNPSHLPDRISLLVYCNSRSLKTGFDCIFVIAERISHDIAASPIYKIGLSNLSSLTMRSADRKFILAHIY
jgi:hypothetical protein